eukprot:11408058-Ditylum_brightwellii.AAC.1
MDQITIYINTAHTTNLYNCRSIGGHVAILAVAAISHSTKWQKIVFTSYTEDDPTMMYKDNTTSIMMKNEWVEKGDITLAHN